jgi:hypothetical protein
LEVDDVFYDRVRNFGALDEMREQIQNSLDFYGNLTAFEPS